jgi:DNA-binding NtrC family response regulator
MKPRGRRKKETATARRAGLPTDLAEVENIEADSRKLDPKGAASRTGTSGRGDLRNRVASSNSDKEFLLFRGLTCAVTAELDLRRLVKTILDQAVSTLGAERGLLFLGRHDATELIPIMAVNLAGQELLAIDKVSRTLLAPSRDGEMVLTQDAVSDPRFSKAGSGPVDQIRSVLCTPLYSPSGLSGALYLDSPQPNAFPEESRALFESIAAVAAVALENASVHGEMLRENTRLRRCTPESQPFERMIGASRSIETLRRQAAIAALMDLPLLITGPPGNGRRLLASIIHQAGNRAPGPIIYCDCSVLASSILRGAILGRVGLAARAGFSAEQGLFRQAHRGTLCLTECQRIPDDLAEALVEGVTQGHYRSMGSRQAEHADVRLILSMQSDVELPAPFAALQKLQLVIPPLVDRPEDIPLLIDHFIKALGPRHRDKITVTTEAMDWLEGLPWPGNVQELYQVLSRIFLSSSKPVIDLAQVREALSAIEREGKQSALISAGRVRKLKDIEEDAIRLTLDHTRGNKAEAARLMGIHRNTLILKRRAMALQEAKQRKRGRAEE